MSPLLPVAKSTKSEDEKCPEKNANGESKEGTEKNTDTKIEALKSEEGPPPKAPPLPVAHPNPAPLCPTSSPITILDALQSLSKDGKKEEEEEEQPQFPLPRIAIVMLTTPSRKSFASSTIAAMESYCFLHGYELIVHQNVLDARRAAPWSKILALQHALRDSDAEWIVWVDDDILITNPHISLAALIKRQAAHHLCLGPTPTANASSTCTSTVCSEERIHDLEAHLIVSEDAQSKNGFPLNTGILAFRNSEWSLEFLETVWSLGAKLKHLYAPWWEQTTITQLWSEREDVKRRTRVVPMPELQAFYRYPETGDPPSTVWSAGCFAAHFTGLPCLVREDLISQMRKQGDMPTLQPSFPIPFQQMLQLHRAELLNICDPEGAIRDLLDASPLPELFESSMAPNETKNDSPTPVPLVSSPSSSSSSSSPSPEVRRASSSQK